MISRDYHRRQLGRKRRHSAIELRSKFSESIGTATLSLTWQISLYHEKNVKINWKEVDAVRCFPHPMIPISVEHQGKWLNSEWETNKRKTEQNHLFFVLYNERLASLLNDLSIKASKMMKIFSTFCSNHISNDIR